MDVPYFDNYIRFACQYGMGLNFLIYSLAQTDKSVLHNIPRGVPYPKDYPLLVSHAL